MNLTPTNEEGIFLLTIGDGGNYIGCNESDSVGEFYDKTEKYIIKGTNGEVFMAMLRF